MKALSATSTWSLARGGSLPLLLYSVFHIGTANNNISYASYKHFKDHPVVEWTIPFSLGDSFHGYRVVATDNNFYEHYQYHGGRSIRLASGRQPEGIFDAVLAAKSPSTSVTRSAKRLF